MPVSRCPALGWVCALNTSERLSLCAGTPRTSFDALAAPSGRVIFFVCSYEAFDIYWALHPRPSAGFEQRWPPGCATFWHGNNGPGGGVWASLTHKPLALFYTCLLELCFRPCRCVFGHGDCDMHRIPCELFKRHDTHTTDARPFFSSRPLSLPPQPPLQDARRLHVRVHNRFALRGGVVPGRPHAPLCPCSATVLSCFVAPQVTALARSPRARRPGFPTCLWTVSNSIRPRGAGMSELLRTERTLAAGRSLKSPASLTRPRGPLFSPPSPILLGWYVGSFPGKHPAAPPRGTTCRSCTQLSLSHS